MLLLLLIVVVVVVAALILDDVSALFVCEVKVLLQRVRCHKFVISRDGAGKRAN